MESDCCSHGKPYEEICDNCDLISRCYEYLGKQGCVLWGQHWDIIDLAERRDAAVWLAGVIAQVAQEPGAAASMYLVDVRSSDDSISQS